MLKIICFSLIFAFACGHTGIARSDSELQSALMPQELNPAYVSEKDSPLRMVIPIDRYRRNADIASPVESTSTLNQVKKYSRVVACVVLAISAVIESVLYVVEVYHGT